MTARPLVRQALAVLALVAAITAPAAAQGKGSKGGHSTARASKTTTKSVTRTTTKTSAKSVAAPAGRGAPKAKALPPGQAKKRVTHAEAVDVSERVLVEQGYRVTKVERRGDTRVIYYYRGNNGRGKGRGPLQRMVVRPRAERFVFEGAPADVVKAVNMRLRF